MWLHASLRSNQATAWDGCCPHASPTHQRTGGPCLSRPPPYHARLRTDTLDFNLPDHLLATRAAEPRDNARLMVCHRATGQVEHRRVSDLPSLGLLQPGDLVVMNRSRVVPARFLGTREATGGKAAGLYLGESRDLWRIMLETRGKPKPGETITLTPSATLTLVNPLGHGEWEARLHSNTPSLALLDTIGITPLPPYIRKARKHRDEPADRPEDATRYNTIYAREPGSVAAPTAGLHFTPGVFAALDALGVARAEVVLHVGLGTFAPVRTARIEDHDIHEEQVTVPEPTLSAIRETQQRGGRILAVGTTTVRALESLPDHVADDSAWSGPTRLFITPDRVAQGAFAWRYTDRLLTNFHLPRSTLLAMVAALPGVGVERLLHWYDTAIAEEYRFYSYGDAMLIV